VTNNRITIRPILSIGIGKLKIKLEELINAIWPIIRAVVGVDASITSIPTYFIFYISYVNDSFGLEK
jgi:hypothetical protein